MTKINRETNREMMGNDATPERVFTFSDGVFAIIITIMILELKRPAAATFEALFELWPTWLSYGVSYMFIAIVWVNHHYVLTFAKVASLKLMWANFAHLFSVSLIPFLTEWIAETKLQAVPVALYASVFMLVNVTYLWLVWEILRDATSQETVSRIRRLLHLRSIFTISLFLLAIIVAFLSPYAGFGIICCCLVLYLRPELPDRKMRSADEPAPAADEQLPEAGGATSEAGRAALEASVAAPGAVGSVKGKIAIVTGASAGIGRATAIRLAKDFTGVALVARREEELAETARFVRANGAEPLVIAADLGQATAAAVVIDSTIRRFGQIDALIHMAGAVSQVRLFEMTDEQWYDGAEIKLHGARRLTIKAWPYLKKTQGSVVMTSGSSAEDPKAGFAAVATINAAIVALAKAFAEQGVIDGVQVNSVLPGPVISDRRLDAKIRPYGEPAEIGELMAFLVSSRAKWMMGRAIRMDGGEEIL